MDFKDSAIQSSKLYYDYLYQNKRYFVEYDVIDIQKDDIYYYLTLNERLRSIDYLQLKINTNIYSDNDIKIISYNSVNRKLTISVNLALVNYIDNAKLSNIKVVSDLKFLVKSVENFYKEYGDRIKLPTHTNDVSYKIDLIESKDEPSDEQLIAINGSLDNPLSYVWGAPGTGKTKFVLARCVLANVLFDKKVLLVAPTNNAIEQTLYGVIPILEEHGIPLTKIFRLGTASYEFTKKYSDCCEDLNLKKVLKELTIEINSIKENITDTKNMISLYPEYMNYVEFNKNFNKCKKDVTVYFDNLQELYISSKKSAEEISINNGKISLAKEELLELNSKKSKYAHFIDKINRLLPKYNQGIRKKLFKNKYEQLKVDLKNATTDLSEIEKKIKSAENVKSKCEKGNKYHNDILNENKINEKEFIKSIKNSTAFCKTLSSTVSYLYKENFDLIRKEFETEIDNYQKNLDRKKEVFKGIENKSIDVLLLLLDKQENDLYTAESNYEKLSKDSTDTKLEKCSIVATTIDTCIRRISPRGNFKPNHILLDEAGYCSLIKGATLCSYDSPITLFGDHMQLPPICLIDDFSGIYGSISLWAQSSIHLEEITTPIEVLRNYLEYKEPKFEDMQKFDLNYTFRFGEKLANILSEYVYSENFHGSETCGTELFYVSCPKPNINTRTSMSECINIINYINKHSDENIGIITPYNLQRKAINEMLRENNIDNTALTVHKSQGREFDTVLFSVVDKTNKWFTDSLKKESNGKCVVNTAVSRAKKKLVLFCDTDYWSTQDKQLIGKIINNATEINLL